MTILGASLHSFFGVDISNTQKKLSHVHCALAELGIMFLLQSNARHVAEMKASL